VNKPWIRAALAAVLALAVAPDGFTRRAVHHQGGGYDRQTDAD
jgi:hypothetical protein